MGDHFCRISMDFEERLIQEGSVDGFWMVFWTDFVTV